MSENDQFCPGFVTDHLCYPDSPEATSKLFLPEIRTRSKQPWIDDNLFHWIIECVNQCMKNVSSHWSVTRLGGFDSELPLAKDMEKHNVKGILLEVLFPSSYPL